MPKRSRIVSKNVENSITRVAEIYDPMLRIYFVAFQQKSSWKNRSFATLAAVVISQMSPLSLLHSNAEDPAIELSI